MSRELKVSSVLSAVALALLCLATTVMGPTDDGTAPFGPNAAISAQTATMSGLRD